MTPAVRRCAVYTRKSTEEGLEQAFNSLDAQREACEAYIESQAHEGWQLVKTAYDDGGFSGGTMERPAVKRLMADLKQGLIDIVVVYKVDRLTRSLADFAKIVEILDGHGASFVSITQQFNTTSSMGRLTLNVLLSFAQFEREVTGERIRDKIAASKRKGMWMGGTVPMGYAVANRQLKVEDSEAAHVRLIFRRYLALGCVSALVDDLKKKGVVSKAKVSRRGNKYGGKPFGRGALYHLLQNELYRGIILHKGVANPGQHSAIVPKALWDKVQKAIGSNRKKSKRTKASTPGHMLTGLMRDDRGNRMSPGYTRKANGQLYRYYFSQALDRGGENEPGSVTRVPAAAIEELVVAELQRRLPQAQAARWSLLTSSETALRVRAMVTGVQVKVDEVLLTLGVEAVAALDRKTRAALKSNTITVPAQLKRTASGKSIVSLDGRAKNASHLDKALIRAVARTNHWRELLESGTARSAHDIARHEGCRVSYITRHLPLAFLAPDLVEAIIDGKQPRGVILKDLKESKVLRWHYQ
ncbi:MAG: recombinase family protein [Reyranella sp.]